MIALMELVEGEDLSQRIARGPMPIDEALPIATQIAAALEGSWTVTVGSTWSRGRPTDACCWRTSTRPSRGEDLVTIPLDGAAANVRPFLANEFGTAGTVFSPDGRYIAYTSDESGRQEVYVRPFPGPGGQVTASVRGGREPAWGRNGELFYRDLTGERMMAVKVQVEPALRLSAPVELFRGEYVRADPPVRQYDVTADGQRFLMLRRPVVSSSGGEAAPPKIVVVENFFEELKRLVPAP